MEKAPLQPAVTPAPLPSPAYPFQMVSTDYFDYVGKAYLLVLDRYSNWQVVVRAKDGSSDELIRVLRSYFCMYGVPEELASDGATVYTSTAMQKFLETWRVRHRISSTYSPHSNLRAETGLKSMK